MNLSHLCAYMFDIKHHVQLGRGNPVSYPAVYDAKQYVAACFEFLCDINGHVPVNEHRSTSRILIGNSRYQRSFRGRTGSGKTWNT